MADKRFDQGRFDSILDEMFLKIGERAQSGQDLPSSGDVLKEMQTKMSSIGVQLSDEEGSAFINQNMPGLSPSVGDFVDTAPARMVGKFLEGLPAATGLLNPFGVTENILNEAGGGTVKRLAEGNNAVLDFIAAIGGPDIQRLPTDFDTTMGTRFFDSLRNSTKDLVKPAAKVLNAGYVPQGTVPKVIEGFGTGLAEFAPEIAAAIWGGASNFSALGREAMAGVTEKLAKTPLGGRFTNWLGKVIGEEAGFGAAFGLTMAAINDKSVKLAQEGKFLEATAETARTINENVVLGAALGLGMRAVFKPIGMAYRSFKGSKLPEAVPGAETPSDLTLVSNHPLFISASDAEFLGKQGGVLDAVNAAIQSGDQEAIIAAKTQLSMTDPTVLRELMRIKGNQLDSIYHSLFEMKAEGELDTLASMAKEWLRADEYGTFTASKFFFDAEQRVSQLRQEIQRLQEVAPLEKGTWEQLEIMHDDVQRAFNELRPYYKPGIRAMLEKQARGEALTAEDKAWINAGLVVEKLNVGRLHPDLTNPAMAKLREIMIPEELASSMMTLSGRRQGVDVTQGLFDWSDKLLNLKEVAKTQDLEGVVQLFGADAGRLLKWSSALGKVAEVKPAAVDGLLQLTDDVQFVEQAKALLRETFAGDKEGLVTLLSSVEPTSQYSGLFHKTIIQKFPATFGDINLTKAPMEDFSKMVRGSLDYGMGIDPAVSQELMNQARQSLEYLRKGGLLDESSYKNQRMVLDFYDQVNVALFGDKGYRPAPLAGMGEAMNAIKSVDNVTTLGQVHMPTGVVRLFMEEGSLASLSAAERNKLLWTGIHELSHTMTYMLPGEAKDSFFKAIYESYRANPDGWAWAFNHDMPKQVPASMVQSAQEAMAELLTKAVMTNIRGNHQAFRAVVRTIPPDVRSAFLASAKQLTASLEKSPFANTAITSILDKFTQVGELMRMESDPFYSKILDSIRTMARPDESVILRHTEKVYPAEAEIISKILPFKGAIDEHGKLTEKGAKFLSEQLGKEFSPYMDMSEVNSAVARVVIERAELIKAKAPQGSRDPGDLLISAVRMANDLQERLTMAGPVGDYYRYKLGPRALSYLKTLNDDLGKLGDVWNKDASKALSSFRELEGYHAILESLVDNSRGANPRLWDSLQPELAGSWVTKTIRALRNTDFWKRHFGDSKYKDLDLVDSVGMTAQWLAKKHPQLGVVFDTLRKASAKKQELAAKLLMNDGNILGDGTVAPLSEYLQLQASAKDRVLNPTKWAEEGAILRAVNKMALVGNDYTNMVNNRGSMRSWGELERDVHGSFTDTAWLFNEVRTGKIHGYGPEQFTQEQLESAYRMYRGLNATMYFIREETHKINTIRQNSYGDSQAISKERLEIGKLLGSIPQMRHGDHALVVELKNGKYYTQFFDAGPVSSLANMARDAMGSKPRNGMAWARDLEASIIREGSTEWGISPADVKSTKIYKRNELPKDVYFGARPTNLDAILGKAFDALRGKEGIDAGLLQDARKELTAALVDLSKGGGFLSHSRFRENVPGWDTANLQQTMKETIDQFAGFHARSAAMEHSLEALKLLHGQPNLFKYANDMIMQMTAGMDKTAWVGDLIRGEMYWHYMAGKVSTAIMQITQNYMMGVPRLGMEGVPRAGRQITGAMREITKLLVDEYKGYFKTGQRSLTMEGLVKRGYSEHEARALHEAQLSGVTWANFTQQFLDSESSLLKGAMGKVMETSALPLRLMEELNRRSIFLVGFRHNYQKLVRENAAKEALTPEELYRTAFERAIRIANDAHIIYDRINLPAWARRADFLGSVGRGAYALKNFSHGYVQFLGWLMREDPRWGNVGKTLGFLAGAGGLSAVPGVSSIVGLFKDSDGVTWKEKLEKQVGEVPANLIINGPLGMWTNFGERLNPVNSTLFSLPTSGIGQDTMRSVDLFQRGDYTGALAYSPLAPAGITAMYKAYEGREIGKLTKSGKLMGVDGKPIKYSFEDAVTQALGFTPYNKDMAYWYRERAKDAFWNEEKSMLSKQIRTEFEKTGKLSKETVQKFNVMRARSAKAGRPMKETNPLNIVRGARLLEDY